MRVVCIEVAIETGALRAAVMEELARALWVAMIARLTFDARLIAVANQYVSNALTVWFRIESLLESPDDGSA
jgi:hypothetical protein